MAAPPLRFRPTENHKAASADIILMDGGRYDRSALTRKGAPASETGPRLGPDGAARPARFTPAAVRSRAHPSALCCRRAAAQPSSRPSPCREIASARARISHGAPTPCTLRRIHGIVLGWTSRTPVAVQAGALCVSQPPAPGDALPMMKKA